MKTEQLAVDPVVLREEVKTKYRDVATNPNAEYHFHTGRQLAKRLGYHSTLVESMPDAAIESFAGVANPFSLRSLERSEGYWTPDQAGVSTALSRLNRLAQRAK